MNKFVYRPEIDGLRAFAVIVVILFHAGFVSFSGGYIGVDVFFVISGYLITSIILEKKRRKEFTLLVDAVTAREIDPYTAVAEVLKKKSKHSSSQS